MELYALDENFIRDQPVDTYISAIWTERYKEAGDFKLVADATPAMISLLSEGSFLSLEGSKEVMLIENQLVEKGLLTVSGPTLLDFLKNRVIRTSVSVEDRSWNLSQEGIFTPGEAIAYIAQEHSIAGEYLGDAPGNYRVGGALNKIPFLTLGDVDHSGDPIDIAVPFGPLYDALKTLAETYLIGMSLYLDSATEAGYSLKFTTYKGLDRTSDQTDRPVVRFSPLMDSLTNIKELRSIANYKTVVYVFVPDTTGGINAATGVAFADGHSNTDTGFNRRTMMVFLDDINQSLIDQDFGVSDELVETLANRGKDILANNNYIKLVDGEVVSQEFQFGTHYGLGDIVELQGISGQLQKAQITEYIRSQDEMGARAYPTVSVLD